MKTEFFRWLMARILSLSSFFGVILFYLLVAPSVQFSLVNWQVIDGTKPFAWCENYWLWTLAVGALFISLSRLSLMAAERVAWLKHDTLQAAAIRPIEATAIPTYIGLFVISLELGDNPPAQALAVLAVLFVLWCWFERVFYFNPMWLLFGYRFYEAEDKAGNSFTVISRRRNLKGAQSLTNLKRINDYTFLEYGYE